MGLDFDAAVVAVALKRGGLVGDEIAAANDLLEIGEAGVKMADGAGYKSCAASEIGEGLQRMLAELDAGLLRHFITGADGVNGDLAVLGGGNGLLESDAAGVVFAIGDDDENAGDGLGFRTRGEFVGGVGNCIP